MFHTENFGKRANFFGGYVKLIRLMLEFRIYKKCNVVVTTYVIEKISWKLKILTDRWKWEDEKLTVKGIVNGWNS